MFSIHNQGNKAVYTRNGEIEALIKRIALSDTGALGELYELIKTDIYAYALSKTANEENAEDIMQNTFILIWKSARQYVPYGKPLAWIFTIEMNLVRQHFNKNKRLIPLDDTNSAELYDADFSEKIITNDFIRQMLSILNEEEREIISLHVVSDLKHREIAKLIGKPISTVLSKYNRAIKKLQRKAKEMEVR